MPKVRAPAEDRGLGVREDVTDDAAAPGERHDRRGFGGPDGEWARSWQKWICLLYTSDAADE